MQAEAGVIDGRAVVPGDGGQTPHVWLLSNAHSKLSHPRPQDMELIQAVLDIVGTVRRAAVEVSDAAGAGGSGGGSTVPADEAALLQRLEDAGASFGAAIQLRGLPAISLLQAVLPPTRRLAAALLDWWRRPRAQQEQQLEAAQAAATRSCAYLRCANLGGSGGPAAGQGEGSQRCR